MTADAPGVPSSNVGGPWARRIDTRREWRAFRDYYHEYLPRAMPRHAYEWLVWEDVKLREGKVLIPGVIAHTTAVVEHPEAVAACLMTFARVVGQERVIAGPTVALPRRLGI
jgi:methionine synthase II (cobalamin-independent)